jgi:dihydropteroate synthase
MECQRVWEFSGFRSEPYERPLYMGIVNVTPDSFSDGGRFLSPQAAVDQGLRLVEEGADLLDIGGESTRPGSDSVAEDEELRRVIPVIEALARQTSVPISVDTCKSRVAQQALQAGARIINDISGLLFDDQMIDVCREASCGIVCMHMQGTPQTMQIAPHYSNVVTEICDFFTERLQTLTSAGIAPQRIVLDPGVGFGKTAQHNVEILSSIERFQSLGRPVLIGHSRKRFLQKVIGRAVDERLYGTIGVSVALASQHVEILRVHDVAANRDAVTAFLATRGR